MMISNENIFSHQVITFQDFDTEMYVSFLYTNSIAAVSVTRFPVKLMNEGVGHRGPSSLLLLRAIALSYHSCVFDYAHHVA